MAVNIVDKFKTRLKKLWKIKFFQFTFGLISGLLLIVLGVYFVQAVTGVAPNLSPGLPWSTTNRGNDPGVTMTASMWNGLVNAVGQKAKIDFSVAGDRTTFNCTPTARTNVRAGIAPGPGVKAAVYNFYKTSELDVLVNFYSTSGQFYETLFSDSHEHHCDCDVNHIGDFAILPVNANGYFACDTTPSSPRGSNATIELTLIAYIY
jgi:hypothetical protein